MTSDAETLGVGECPTHGYVTEDDGAIIRFPTDAECHCGRELERATFADAETVRSRA